MKKRVLLTIVVLLVLFSILVSGFEQQEGGLDFTGGSNNFDPETFNYETDPIQNVPPDQLDPDKVKQFGKEQDLTLDQLIHKNPDGTYNLDKFDPNKLNEDVRDEALKLLGKAKKVESQTGNFNTQITSFDDGWEIDKILLLTIDDIHIVNGQGITYRDNKVSIDHAETLYTEHGALFNVDDFAGTSIEFDVGSVNQVQDGCISVYDLKDSHLRSDDQTLTINPTQPTTFSIKDCSKTETEFEAFGNDSRITISKDHARYDIAKGTLTCENLDKTTDTITANNTASLDISSSCFDCLTIDPVGTYWHRSKQVISDFGITIPQDGNSYRLCLKKMNGVSYADYDGLVDFEQNFIELTDIVTYYRLPFVQHSDDYSLLEPFLPLPVYESYDPNNKVQFTLNTGFVHLTNLTLTNQNPETEGILSFIYQSHYGIYETHSGGTVKRYARFTENQYPTVIKSYTSDFGKPAPVITFARDTLNQIGINKEGTLSQVQAVCHTCGHKERLIKEIEENDIQGCGV